LASLLEIGLLATGAAATPNLVSNPAAGTLSRPKMADAAAPTTRTHASATIVMARVNKVSIPPNFEIALCKQFPEN